MMQDCRMASLLIVASGTNLMRFGDCYTMADDMCVLVPVWMA